LHTVLQHLLKYSVNKWFNKDTVFTNTWQLPPTHKKSRLRCVNGLQTIDF